MNKSVSISKFSCVFDTLNARNASKDRPSLKFLPCKKLSNPPKVLGPNLSALFSCFFKSNNLKSIRFNLLQYTASTKKILYKKTVPLDTLSNAEENI